MERFVNMCKNTAQNSNSELLTMRSQRISKKRPATCARYRIDTLEAFKINVFDPFTSFDVILMALPIIWDHGIIWGILDSCWVHGSNRGGFSMGMMWWDVIDDRVVMPVMLDKMMGYSDTFCRWSDSHIKLPYLFGKSGWWSLDSAESSEISRIQDQTRPLQQPTWTSCFSFRPQDKLAKYAFYGTTLVVEAPGDEKTIRARQKDQVSPTEAFIITIFLTTFLRIEGMFTDFCHLAEAQLAAEIINRTWRRSRIT